jgi:hypothetical protein
MTQRPRHGRGRQKHPCHPQFNTKDKTKQNERKIMNNKFDELAKGMAQSVTRRGALKKFGVGLAGMALACFGLASIAQAGKANTCATNADCRSGQVCCNGACVAGIPDWCDRNVNPCCCYCAGKGSKRHPATALPSCDPSHGYCVDMCGGNFGC